MELKDSCRVWLITIEKLGSQLRTFQDCLWLQKLASQCLWVIDESIPSDVAVSDENAVQLKVKRPNNGVVVLIGHGLGGILVQATSALLFALPSKNFRDLYVGLKQKHWRLILLGSPQFINDGQVFHRWEGISVITDYYGGKVYNRNHTKEFWIGLHTHARCLITNN